MTNAERDGVLTLLHDTMEDRTAAPPAAPVWPKIERGLRRARRRRRARTAGKAGAGVLAFGALLAGVQTNALPYPTWATLPSAGGGSVLADGGTRGSLADDVAWLDGLRQAVADGEVKQEEDGEWWAPPSASDVDVIYAGDVGAYRLALVEADWRWGVIAARQQVWLQGRAGAAPGELTEGMNNSPEDVSVYVAHAGSHPADMEPIVGQAAVVVLSPRSLDLRLRHPAEYAADGTVRRAETKVAPTGDGLYEALVTEPGGFELMVPGRRYPEQVTAFHVPDAVEVPVTGALPPVHGTAVPPTDELHAEVAAALDAADLAYEGTPRRLLWAGEIGGDRYRVVGMTAPGGARVLVVLRHDFSGPDLATWVVSGDALPRGPMERAALAWPVAEEGPGDEPVPSGRVAVLGPVGATAAVLLAGGDEVGRAPLRDGFATAQAPTATSVRFLDTEGRTVGDAPLAPLRGGTDTLVGALTR